MFLCLLHLLLIGDGWILGCLTLRQDSGSLFLGRLALGRLLVSGTSFVVPVQGQFSVAFGLSGCQMPKCCADGVLWVYAPVWSRSLSCELQVLGHIYASVLQRLGERSEGFGKSPDVKMMFWRERQLPQGRLR